MLLWKNIFNVEYLENGERYDVGLKGGQIGNRPWLSIGTMTFALDDLDLGHRILASHISKSNTMRDTKLDPM